MAEEALHNAAAGSLSEPDDSALFLDVSRFLESLTDRQLQVMQRGMREKFTRDKISGMMRNIVKIVTTLSRKIIVPKLGEAFNVDLQSLFPARPGSSSHSLELVAKDLVNAILKTIGGSLDEKEDSGMLEPLSKVTEQIELLASTHGSVELLPSSPPVEPSTEKPNELTPEDNEQLQECAKEVILEIYTIYECEELKRARATDPSYSSKMCITVGDFVECLLSELDDMTASSRSSSISDDISPDPACAESESPAVKALKRTQNFVRVPSLVKLSSMASKMETQVKTSTSGQTLRNTSPYAKIFVDELLSQLESCTKPEVSEDDQAKFTRGSSDTSLTAEVLVDRILAYIQQVSASPFGDDMPTVPPDFQIPSVLRSSSAKSFQKIQSEGTRTKAAQEVSEIFKSFIGRSLHSLSAHTSQADSSVEPTLSECSAKASALVDSVIDGICKHWHCSTSSNGLKEKQSEPLDGMDSGPDVSEENLRSTAFTVYNIVMSQLRDFSATYQQKAGTVNPSEINVGYTVDKIQLKQLAVKDQLALSKDHHSSEEPQQTVSLPGTPTFSESSKGKGKNSHPQTPTVKITDEQELPKSRGRVSMATLVDTMMTSLGLPGSGHFISLEELSAATKRVDDLFSTAATQEFTEMVQLILKDRLTSLNISDSVLDSRRRPNHTLQQDFTLEFLGEFADESVKRLLMSCIVPEPGSAFAKGIPSLVMPFRVTPESFEISRPPSEVFADTIDLFTKVIVNNVMDNVSALSDHAVVSNTEETPEIDPHSSEQLNTGPPVISVAALHHCIHAVLQKVQETSSTGVHGSSLLIADDQIQKVTDDVKGILALFTAVTVEDGEHAIKELHHSIIDAVYAELLQRIRSKSELTEAVKAQTQLLTGSLAVSIVKAIKNTDAKDLYRPPSVQSGSSPSIKEEPLVCSLISDDALLASQVSQRGLLKSDTKDLTSVVTLLVLRVLAQSAASSSDLTEASSNNPKELIERILREFSATSSASKLDEVLSGTFGKLLQRFGEEGFLRKTLNPRDPAFNEALVTALRKHLDAEASTAVSEKEETKDVKKDVNLKKCKSSFFRLKMPKINIFKKKPKKDDSAGSRTSDQNHLQSRGTADKGGSNSATSNKEKPWRPSIITRMFSCFRK